MDWDLAIKRNSEALKGIVAALFAMLGLAGEATVARIPQPLHRAVLRVLRPAESAMRRLIVIAARGLVVKLAPSRPHAQAGEPSGRAAGSTASLLPALRSAEKFRDAPRRRKATRIVPRIHIFGSDPTVASLWAARPPRPIPLRRPMASSTPSASAGGSRPSSWRSRICRARPGVSPAGG